jgi:hypothetical protein
MAITTFSNGNGASGIWTMSYTVSKMYKLKPINDKTGFFLHNKYYKLISLTEENRFKTTDVIRSIVGDIDNFITNFEELLRKLIKYNKNITSTDLTDLNKLQLLLKILDIIKKVISNNKTICIELILMLPIIIKSIFDLNDYKSTIEYNNTNIYIEYHYYIEGEEVVFKSPYIAKIIDYGRCYFNELGETSITGNSQNFYKKVISVCGAHTLNLNGFRWLAHDKSTIQNTFYISSQLNNPSHDLRLLKLINYGGTTTGNADLDSLLNKVVYSKGVPVNGGFYGTEPNTTSGLPSKINNVRDAFESLLAIVKNPLSVAINNKFYSDLTGKTKLGELHIYGDGGTPMRFKPTPK